MSLPAITNRVTRHRRAKTVPLARWMPLLVLGLLLGNSLFATTFTVSTGANAGVGSLRQAILDVNAAPAGSHNIVFTVPAVNLTASLPAITHPNVTIDGGGTVTISSPGADNTVYQFTIGTGANNTVIRGFTLQNMGVEPVKITGNVSGVVLENMTWRQTGVHYMNHGLYTTGIVTNLTLRNINITQVQDKFWGLRFGNTVNGLLMDKVRITGGAGLTARGIQFEKAASNVIIKNSTIDMDDPATTDDGDYGILFSSTVTGLTIDSTIIRDCETYGVFITAQANNVSIKNSTFDNLDGSGTVQLLRLHNGSNTVLIDNCTFNADLRSVADDGNHGIVIDGVTRNITISNCTFTENDANGTYFGVTGGCDHDGIFIRNNTYSKNGYGADLQGGIRFYARNLTSDGDSVRITGNTFVDNNGEAIGIYTNNTTTYVVPNFEIRGNTFRNTKTTFGTINVDYVDKIRIIKNSIYNNQGLGVQLTNVGNCGYEGTNKPLLVSSTPLSANSYQLKMTLPPICAAGCEVEVFANDANTKGVGGQYYVTTLTGVLNGTSTHTITSNLPAATTAPYGTWTAYLRIPGNACGTSEFSNKTAIRINGPAGVDAGVQLWMNPDVTDPGNLVNTQGWEDFSGNNRHFDMVFGDPIQVEGGINYNHYLNFDGNDYLRSSSSPFVAANTAGEVFTVTKTPTVGTTNGNPYDFGSNSRGSHYRWSDNAIYNGFGTSKRLGWNPASKGIVESKPGVASVTGTAVDVTKWNLFGTHSAANSWGVYFNGEQIITSNTNVVSFALAAGNEHVGAVSGGVYNGDIAEEVLYNRKLTPNERQRVNSYLGVKYGLTLNHNYIASDSSTIWWNLTTNTGYNNDMAGLARDNRSVMNQKQSKSVNDDDVVSAGMGNAFYTTVFDNPNEVLNNKSAFMWGNNNLASTFTVAYATAYSDMRMARVWKVQKTGWQDTTVIIRLENSTENRTLLISNDPTFATVTSYHLLNDSGCVILNSNLLANGSYFTFANRITGPGCVNTGIKAWYKASGYQTGSGLWVDNSGNSNHANGTANYPKRLHNYNRAIDFNGLNMEYMPSIYAGGTYPWEMFIVNVGSGPIYSKDIVSDNCHGGPIYYGQGVITVTSAAGVHNSFGTTLPAAAYNIPHINNTTRTAGGATNLYVNHAANGAATFTQMAGVYGQPQLGGRYDYGCAYLPSDVEIPEAIFYSAPLTAPQRLRVNSYLALKYGITLSQVGPTDYVASNGTTRMWTAADNTGYNFNITGIGKDLCTGLEQKQSKSVNAQGIVAVSVGTEVASENLTNVASVTNDLSFLTFADNNGTRTFATTITGTTATLRMQRVWKADKTNWADQDITLKYFGNATNTYLLISTGATFATVDQEFALNADSSITFNSSLLPDGAFFTFGKEIKGPGGVPTGIAAWWRGDYGLTPEVWEDYSGYGIDVPQPNAALQPATNALVNFNPSPDFGGSKYYGLGNVVDVPSSALGNSAMNNVAIFGVSVPNNATAYGAFFAQYTTNGYLIEAAPSYGAVASSTVYWDAPYGWRLTAASGVTANKGNVWTFTKTVASMEYYRDHQMLQQSVLTRDFTGYNGGNYASNIGIWNSGGSTFNGTMPEVVVYKDISAMSANERLRIESYLAVKYGVSLNQTVATNYVATDNSLYWAAANNVGYTNRITGIGRDDKTDLNQKQSRNQDAGYLITMALGDAVQPDNATNTAIMDNLSYFMWADNNGTTLFNAAVSSVPNATARMNRVWKVDKTATWADQNITINVSQNGDRYLLIHATDPNFGAGAVEYTLNTGTGSVTINTADIPDGAYFTLATRISGPACVNAGIKMWLRADYSATGANWSDYSGNQISATQVTAANQPVLNTSSVNFNPGLTFNGTASWMVTPALTAPDFASNSYFAMNKPNNVASYHDYLSAAASASSIFEFRQNAASFEYGEATAATFAVAPGTPLVVNTPLISSVTQTSGTNGIRLFKNGGLLSTGTVNLNHPNASATLEIGRRHGTFGAAFYYSGQMLEVIAYNRVLADYELQKVNSYLSLKYGLTLNNGSLDYVASDWNGSTGTKMWTAASNVGFVTRITGIGRDDCTDLHQKQSLNQDGGSVTIATGTTVQASNVANADTILTNNSYFVFADNNKSAEFSQPVAGTNVTQRMARTWKVDKTNWTDQYITLKSTYGGDDVYLLINTTDSAFATLDQELPIAVDSALNFSSSLLPDGAYFTFGKRITGPACVNSGIRVWLDANQGLTIIPNGYQWNDRSGNELHVAQTTDAREADLGTANMAHNYNAFLDFDGDDVFETDKQVLKSATSSGSVFFVSKYRDLAGYDSPVDFDADDPHIGRLAASSGIYKSTSSPVQYFPGANQTLTQDKTHLSGYLWTGGVTNSGVELRLDAASSVDNTMEFNAMGYTQDFGVGAYINGAEGINGTMSEVIVYNRKLTAPEANQVESYLALKYGISLSQAVATNYTSSNNSVLMWQASANVGYTSNITGLGRDDCGGLEQKQSRSANAGSLFSIGMGNSLAADNASNTIDIGNDLSFFVWADNNLASTFTIPVTSTSNATVRMARVWKVDKTNWNDANITIKVDQNGDRYLLVHSSDPTFGAGAVEYALNTSSGELVINTADLPDGAYFTVASRIVGPGCVNTGLQTWLRSDYGVLRFSSTGKVNSWADFSGNQHPFAQTDSTKSPIYSVTNSYTNFQPAIYFNSVATNQFLGSSTNLWSAGQAGTGIAVAFHANVAASYSHLIDQNDEPSLLKWPGVAQLAVYDNGTVATNVTAPVLPNLQNNVSGIMGITFGTTGNTYNIYQNGFAGAVTHAAAPSVVNGNMRIGLQVDNTDPWNGGIQEVVVYNRQLTANELLRVNSYLALKHGVTLANGTVDYVASDWNGVTGTKMWSAADNSGYGYRITGVGRDDCDELDQRQSRNRDGGNIILAMGNSIETSNGNNTNTIGNSNSYFVFGDNNGANIYTLPVSGAIATQGMQRVWKVDKTNWNDADIFLKSSLAGGSDVYLVVSSSPTFGTLTAEIPMNADSTVAINTFQIPDGAYFTFAKRVIAPGCVGTPTLWVKADSGLTGAPTNITAWADQSPFARTLTKTGAGTLAVPAQGLNYNPVIDFPNNAWVNIPQFTSTMTAGEIFSVQVSDQPNSHATYRFPWEMGGTFATGAGYAYTGNHYSYFGSTTRKNFALGAVDVLSPHILNTYSAPADWAVAFDGTTAYTTATNTVNFTPTPVANAVGGGHTAVFDGKISEVILYDRKLSVFERQKVNSYLAVKYGLTVAHDYYTGSGLLMWDRTNGALNATSVDEGYSNNIAAIDFESCGSVVQRQSRSSNSSNEVIIASGSIKPSNAANAADTSFDDGDFLIWGADGTSAYTFNASHEGTPNLRLNRTWKIRDNGGVGRVQLAIPKAALTAAGVLGECDAYMLLVSTGNTDPGINWTSANAVEYILSEQPVNGVNCYVTNVTFDADADRYFTFGRLQSKGANPYLVADNATLTALEKCESSDWIYFLDPSDESRRIMAIQKNGNTIDAADFSVTIDVTTDQSSATGSALGKAESGPTGGAVFLMRRLAQVNFTPAVGHSIVSPVAVRLYWDNGAVSLNEKQAALDNLNALITANGITPATAPAFAWFKAGGQDIASTLAGLTADGVNNTTGSQQWTETASAEHAYGTDGSIPFVQFLNVTSFSTFGGLWIVNDPEVTPLPVTLLNYTATKEGRRARLDWTTVTEINNDHFVIERSTDLIQWAALGTVPGAGSSNQIHTYFLYDPSPAPGVNYYRLTQVDYDGTVSMKGIRSLNFDGEEESTWHLFPNPATEQQSVTLLNIPEGAQISLISVDGKVLHTLQAKANSLTVPTHGLKPGIYFVRVNNETKQLVIY